MKLIGRIIETVTFVTVFTKLMVPQGTQMRRPTELTHGISMARIPYGRRRILLL